MTGNVLQVLNTYKVRWCNDVHCDFLFKSVKCNLDRVNAWKKRGLIFLTIFMILGLSRVSVRLVISCLLLITCLFFAEKASYTDLGIRPIEQWDFSAQWNAVQNWCRNHLGRESKPGSMLITMPLQCPRYGINIFLAWLLSIPSPSFPFHIAVEDSPCFCHFQDRSEAELTNRKLRQQLADYKVPDVSLWNIPLSSLVHWYGE